MVIYNRHVKVVPQTSVKESYSQINKLNSNNQLFITFRSPLETLLDLQAVDEEDCEENHMLTFS